MAESLNYSTHETYKVREMLHRQIFDAVSHDLKTPLATIIGSLEIHEQMAAKLTPEKKAVLLTTALAEAYRLDNFITNILDMAKLEGHNVGIRLERFNLASLINDCVTKIGPKRSQCKINLIPSVSDLTVNTDRMLLSRAIGLILENAVKHSGKEPVIDVEYALADKEYQIRIRDNGPGIPSGKEQAIFEKYIRFAKADHQNAGTGLGLSICRQILALLSGEVTAENHAQGGAVFSIRLAA